MVKKDISKILMEGSPRQRVVLLSTDSYQEYLSEKQIKKDAKPLLTAEERQNLIDSFKTPQEIKLYNKYAKVNRNLGYLLLVLSETKLRYDEAIAYITGFAISWQDYQFVEQTFNNILYEVKEKKIKDKIKKTILRLSPFMFAGVEEDKEGFIRVLIDSDNGKIRLKELIEGFSNKATDVLVQAKSYIKAIRDYLTEEDFLIQCLEDILNHYEKKFQEDRAIYPKYSKRQMQKFTDDGFFMFGFGHLATTKGITVPKQLSKETREKLENMLDKYFVFPNYDELEISEKYYSEIREGIK